MSFPLLAYFVVPCRSVYVEIPSLQSGSVVVVLNSTVFQINYADATGKRGGFSLYRVLLHASSC